MSKSLRDQLVAAGLATQAEAKKAEKQNDAGRRRRNKSKSSGKAGSPDKPAVDDPAALAKERARQARYEKIAQDKARAQADNERAARIALRAEIKQLVVQHDQRRKESRDDDVPYNFVHDQKVKRFYVGTDQVPLLSRGELIVVHNKGKYYLIDRETADRVRAKDASWIVVAHSDKAADGTTAPGKQLADEEAAYKGFEIPDDLDW